MHHLRVSRARQGCVGVEKLLVDSVQDGSSRCAQLLIGSTRYQSWLSDGCANKKLTLQLLQIVENRDASHGTFLLPQCSDWRRDIIGGMMQVMAP